MNRIREVSSDDENDACDCFSRHSASYLALRTFLSFLLALAPLIIIEVEAGSGEDTSVKKIVIVVRVRVVYGCQQFRLVLLADTRHIGLDLTLD
jgi:hypothetical protein